MQFHEYIYTLRNNYNLKIIFIQTRCNILQLYGTIV
jgi:hypothetical protein